jgi:hypothetical protein
VEADPDVFLSTVAYPIKGTPYYEEVADRILSPKAWEKGSDRELRIAGRRSRRFYQFANRWIVGEVGLAKATRSGSWIDAARAFANSRLGRLGMRLTRNQVEKV